MRRLINKDAAVSIPTIHAVLIRVSWSCWLPTPNTNNNPSTARTITPITATILNRSILRYYYLERKVTNALPVKEDPMPLNDNSELPTVQVGVPIDGAAKAPSDFIFSIGTV